MTFDQFSAFYCTSSCIPSSRLFLCIFISTGVVILFLQMKSFEEFKICQTLLGIMFKYKDVWRFLELIPFLEASCSTSAGSWTQLRWTSSWFCGSICFWSRKKVLITFLDLFISLAITENKNPLSLNLSFFDFWQSTPSFHCENFVIFNLGVKILQHNSEQHVSCFDLFL